MQSKLSKRQRKNLISFILKESKRDLTWYEFRRWINIDHVDDIVNNLLLNPYLDKITHEYLLSLSVHLNRVKVKFKSKTMPYKAFKVLLKPLIKIYKRT